MKIWALVLAVYLLLSGFDAQAKRLGGGRSIGKPSAAVTQQQAQPNAPVGAANAATNTAAQPATNLPAGAALPRAAATPQRSWGSMVSGVAAGLGLAWLASAMGLGEVFSQFMVFALLALVIMLALGWFMRMRRSAKSAASTKPSGYALQGAGSAQWAISSYSPEHVGNDASARPWERNSMAFQAPASLTGQSQSTPHSVGVGTGVDVAVDGLPAKSTWGVPVDFDVHGFLASAKQNFITLQAAWDRSDIQSLRAMMTDGMLGEIQAQLAEREQHTGVETNQTEVAALDAKLLGIEDLSSDWMASVEFSGMIKEDPAQSPAPFREVWNMTKPKTLPGGWLVAGVQALQ
jgi:predicted lipid-binding transport protein (Tim44 family)